MSAYPLVAISDFCETGSGGTPNRTISDYFRGNIPWVKSGELREGVIVDTEEKITERAIKESSAKIVPKGAILLAMYGATVGRMAFLGVDAATNQAVCNIRPDPTRAFAPYVFHCLQTRIDYFLNIATGGAQPNISQGIIRNTEIPLPSLGEQRRIAAILDKADALRRKRRRALELLDGLTQSIFLENFGEAAGNPRAFPTTKLGDLCDFRGGSQPPKSTFSYEPGPEKVRLIQIRDYKTDAFATYIPEKLAKRPCSKDDVMIGRYGPPLFQILKGLEGSYNVALMKADPKPGIYRSFLYYLLRAPRLQADVIAQSERSAGQTGVNLRFLNEYPAYLPPRDLQVQFEDIVSKYALHVLDAKKSMNSLNELFASLQERAFSGKL